MEDGHSTKPWLSPDFEDKFRRALGREMRPEEREFFGLQHQFPLETRLTVNAVPNE